MYIINHETGVIVNADKVQSIYIDGLKVVAKFGVDPECDWVQTVIASCYSKNAVYGVFNKIRCAIISGDNYIDLG